MTADCANPRATQNSASYIKSSLPFYYHIMFGINSSLISGSGYPLDPGATVWYGCLLSQTTLNNIQKSLRSRSRPSCTVSIQRSLFLSCVNASTCFLTIRWWSSSTAVSVDDLGVSKEPCDSKPISNVVDISNLHLLSSKFLPGLRLKTTLNMLLPEVICIKVRSSYFFPPSFHVSQFVFNIVLYIWSFQDLSEFFVCFNCMPPVDSTVYSSFIDGLLSPGC